MKPILSFFFFLFLSGICFGVPDLAGTWFVFLGKQGLLLYRTDYDCVISRNQEWSFIRQENGAIVNSGHLFFTREGRLLLVLKRTGKNAASGIPAYSQSDSEFKIQDPFSDLSLIFRKNTVLPDRKIVKGIWRFQEQDLESGKVNKSPFKIIFAEDGTFSVRYAKDKKKTPDPEAGRWKLKNGFLTLSVEQAAPLSFWDKPSFFFDRGKMVLNRRETFVFGERE